MNPDPGSRFEADFLETERHFRCQAEELARELRGVLIELAQRLGGKATEDLRRGDPAALHAWSPAAWRAFFAALKLEPETNSWAEMEKETQFAALQAEVQQLEAENERLARQLTASLEVQKDDSLPPEPAEPHTLLAENWRLLSHAALLDELRSLQFPARIPVRFENRFPSIGLKQEDWERQIRRRLIILYLLARGLEIRMEIDHLVGAFEKISDRGGSLRRAYDGLKEKNLVDLDTLAMSAPKTSLALLTLTEDGKELCHILGWEPLPGERRRLNELHEGQRFPQHTLSVLIFAMHARLRGRRVATLPDLGNVSTPARPDVYIERPAVDESDPAEALYVEVEMSDKDLAAKWSNLVGLQGGVALCARDAARRARLVGDCKLKNLRGQATDLEVLIAPSAPDITAETPLWVEKW